MDRYENEEDEIDLRELVIKFKRYFYSILFIMLLTVLATATYLYFTKSVYSSSVTIALDNKEQNNISNMLPSNFISGVKDEERLQLAKVTIESKKFIKTIIDRVNIDRELFIQKNFKKHEVKEFSDIKIDIIDIDSTLYGVFLEIVPISNQEFKLNISDDMNGIEYSKIHKYNENIKSDFFSLRVIRTEGEDSFDGAIEHSIMDMINNSFVSNLIKPRYFYRVFDKDVQIDTILKNISVSDLSDNILKISYQDNMPEQAKEVVEEIAKSFIEYNLGNKTSELEQTLAFLDKQIIEIKSNLKNRGDKLQKHQQRSGSAVMSTGEDILESLDKKKEMVDKLSLQLDEVKKFRTSLQLGVLSTVSLISSGIDTYSIQSLMETYITSADSIEELRLQQNNIGKSLTSNVQIVSLISEIKEKEAFLQNLMSNFTSEHPQVIEEQSVIDLLHNKIHSTIVANIQKLQKSRAMAKSTILSNMQMVQTNLKNKLRLLKSGIREKKALLRAIPKKQMENDNLKRKFVLSGDIYTFLLQKRIEVEISKASTIANTKILEDAYISVKPIKPNKKLTLMVSLIIGFILGIIYMFIKEFFDTKIRDINDIEKLTSVPIYGTLPLSSNKRFFKEALRNIRTNLQFVLSEDRECTNILISSTVAGEGKTTITAGLSEVISNADKRVLVMDLDLRKPRLYKELKRSNKIGMSNYLTGDLEVEHYIQSINDNLDFFPAGSVPPNPSELLMSKKFNEVISILEKNYDYILFDSAPIGSVTDSNMILRHTDILLLTIRANMAEKVYLENFTKMLKEKNIKSAGVVLNGVKLYKSRGYGYSYGYGYGYDYGYGEEKSK